MANEMPQLEQLEINPWRVLVIAAHPGDIEYAATSLVAKWTAEGVDVVYLIASRGEMSMPGVEPEQAALIRSGEQSASAAIGGVHIVDFLDVDDGTIQPTIALRRSIVATIRRFAPDVVLIMNHREFRTDGTYNHSDHRAVGSAALDAIASSGNQWVFRDIGKPHSVDVVLVVDSPSATHAIDISGFQDVAVRALSEHQQQLASIAPHAMADPNSLLTALHDSGNAVRVERVEFGNGQPCQSHVVKDAEDDDGPLPVGKVSKRGRAPKPRTPKRIKQASVPKFKARLEQKGKSIGIEVPERIAKQLGGGKRLAVTVKLKSTTFDAAIGNTGGKRFIVLNAERRKDAGIQLDDTFFVTLTPRAASE